MGVRLESMLIQCERYHLRNYVMDDGNGARFLALERGGRVFGPFWGNESGLLWACDEWHDAEAFRILLQKGEWNVGGDRVWIGPEIAYHIQDRANPRESMRIPKAVDPGRYRLKIVKNGCILRLRAKLCSYHIMRGTARIRLQKKIRSAANPLRELADYHAWIEGVQYAGYTQEVRLQISGNPSAEGWNISQISTPAEIFIPCADGVSYADYYEPIDESIIKIQGGVVRLHASGKRRYKVGFKAAQIRGDIVSIWKQGEKMCLQIKRFLNNPSAEYAEEPADRPSEKGFSIHIYNDDGALGGFAELECNLPPASRKRLSSTETIVNWFFHGEKEQLERIAYLLTGVVINEESLRVPNE